MLQVNLPWNSANRSLNKRVILLILSWLCGFFAGLYMSAATFDTYASLMRTAVSGRVSIVGLIAALTFPLILSAISVQLSAPLLFLPLSFVKSFGLAYCAYSALYSFGTAGWLVTFFLLFSDFSVSMVLLWFWIRNISHPTHSFRKDILLCAGLVVMIGNIDCLYISPFLRALFH